MFNKIKNIHFIGIGGIGMSGIAEVLINSGYSVSGSDIKSSAVTQRLSSLGANIFYSHEPSQIQNTHVVVVSSAINRNNPELLAATQQRIPIIHRSEMLAELMRLKYGVIVAGTHGKTTTTSMLATVLNDAKLDPTVVIGGRLNASGSNASTGRGDLFLAEADESDGSFLRLTPTIAVLTNIDRDHMDHYDSFDSIFSAFESFVDKVPFYGAICACIDDPAIQMLIPRIRRKLLTFGIRRDADISVENFRAEGFSMHFTPIILGRKAPPVELKMPGQYNMSNALASFAVGEILGIDPQITSLALSQFQGVLHRFTIVGQTDHVTVVDDYAHNPAKILAVLKGARESNPTGNICAVFQPHRYTRLKHLLPEFSRAFSDADYVIITPIYASGEQPIAGINCESVAHQIKQNSFQGKTGHVAIAQDLEDAARQAVVCVNHKKNENKSIIVTLGAGDIQTVSKRAYELLTRASL